MTILPNTLSFLILLYFIRSRWTINRSFIEPGVFFALNLIILYPVRALTLFYLGSAAIPSYPDIFAEGALEYASWLSVLGCLGFVVGYNWILGSRRCALLNGRRYQVQHGDTAVCAVFLAAAMIGIAYKIATGDYMSYLISNTRIVAFTQIGGLLERLQWTAYIGVWVLWFKGVRTKTFLVTFICAQCVVVPYQFIQGSKTFLSLVLVSIVVAYYWVRGKIPKLTLVASVTIVVLFIFPFVFAFREFVNQQYGQIPRLAEMDLNEVFQSYNTSKAEGATLEEKMLAVPARYSGIDELSRLSHMIPEEIPYRYGSEYLGMLWTVIPRGLWPDKPIYSRGAIYGAALDTITSITPFPFGEGYWDLGVVGVFAGMCLWGGCLAAIVRIYARLYAKPNLSFFIAAYFLSQIYWIAGGESSMGDTVSGLPQEIAILSFVYIAIRSLSARAGGEVKLRQRNLLSIRSSTSNGLRTDRLGYSRVSWPEGRL